MDVHPFLKVMVDRKASDLFITAGFPPSAKIDGELRPLSDNSFNPEQSLEFVESLMTEVQKKEFHESRECNFAFAAKDLGRFRVSAFWQRESPGCVMRRIETKIPEVDDLKLPPILKDLVMSKRGLIIMVGGTGTGKSTSLAALVGYRNAHARGHILTIEDPVEFVHDHRKSIITQREVGIDTDSFDAALKSSLRQAPDVILIGEIRTQETMEFALTFAETGHLCMATLHANNANQALDRIMHLVPESKHNQLLFDLSLNLRGIVAQQLVAKSDGSGRRAAIEVLINTPRIASLIANNELHLLKETMAKSREQGMQTFDQALLDLYLEKEISYADALHHADSPNDLRLMIKLQSNEANSSGMMDGVTFDMN
ncbi:MULTISPECIES: PilT/PilU family type 4a pilus ATPase [unclassified Shewanella]|uniref:PilT/PilU family type 4a pilus ATPase n=1 Tax=unclassified Shewanella TaxID=196818 RepID=UPI000C852528|nr:MULTISPECIES: PilT/PilU family type 4a pilus ATPase [unclassified Shewanella]MDO6617587.1 PilT/PilU family type 4a pilus ATPase [Shewanella sp. 6_MG-2023]MDO6639207.1 PilT/PilU family type 4a pilus ATPase [Shewanella sp. 5_MG-2023]MDO6680331.1 PilT/PilU family type 4a pilus ATPase [Shewanella sp. 4_MG-2023]MDO6776622.1 PilT/PilU family type 4a pilus ATPase [Shewanella sp. 3_MG-2023]PMG31489.1 type IV pili twitching motility protein PilT [Shewanella sp. 10N.286.52.C2]